MRNLGIKVRNCYILEFIGKIAVENPSGVYKFDFLEKVDNKYGNLNLEKRDVFGSMLEHLIDSEIIFSKGYYYYFDPEIIEEFRKKFCKYNGKTKNKK